MSNIRIGGGDANKMSINLPQMKNNVRLTSNSKSAPASVSTNSDTNKTAKSKFAKNEESNPEKLAVAAEVQYAQLQAIFMVAEDNGLFGLQIDEFKHAMRKTVGQKMTDDEIELLYMKVDADNNGVIDWEEYVTYNLMEYQGKALMFEMMRGQPFPPESTQIQNQHRDTIVSIAFYPHIQKKAGRNYTDHTSGRYITVSKEGVLSIWDMKMKHVKTYNNLIDATDRSTPPWLLGLVCMYNVGLVGLSSTDRDITLYDMQGSHFLKRHCLTGLDNCITCMSYWVNLSDLNNAILSWGDTSGSVYVFVFNQCLHGGPFGSYSGSGKRTDMMNISVPEIFRGFCKGVKAYRFNRLHGDWVLMVRYSPELSSVISCCHSTDTALLTTYIGRKKTKTIFRITKGVLCFHYCRANTIIATGGMDYLVRVYNPYVNTKPIFVLKVHTKPVSHVSINHHRNQIVSVDQGLNIRVCDMKDQRVMQQISGRLVKLGRHPLSAVYYNPVLQTLIIATNQLAVLEKQEEEKHMAEIKSHNKPIVAALYNKPFKYVVSACQDSVISVWDLYSGEKIIQTVNAHVRRERGVEYPVEITTMSFDGPQRRVITGARDGSIKIWNFNNGNCYKTFNTPDRHAITGVIHINNNIFATGWSRLVHVYIDGEDEELRIDWKRRHQEDIFCMSYLCPNILATGSYDGDIVVWSRDTGKMYCTLNASKGTKPITSKTDNRPDTSDNSEPMNALESITSKTDNRPDTSDNSEPMNALESITMEEVMKLKTGKVRDDLDMLNIVKTENVLSKDNKGSRHINILTDSSIAHPLLPLFHSQTPSPADEKSSSQSFTRPSSRREKYDELFKLYESAIESILFLETRDRENSETAIMMTSGAEGWIRAWSIHYEGGLVGQFNAAHKIGESVHTMTTDEKNQYLITADSLGYIKIWDITEYCTKSKLSKSEREMRWKYLCQTFTYLRFTNRNNEAPDSLTSTKNMPVNINTRPPPAASQPETTLVWPFLVNSFRAHAKMINKIDYVEEHSLLITASTDCSIRIWTINGLYIGTFGKPWKSIAQYLGREPTANIHLPIDLHRLGSASTLKVLNRGRSGLWTQALDVLKLMSRIKQQEEQECLEPESYICSQSSTIQTPSLQEEREKPKSAPTPKTKATIISGRSIILGKSYKKTMRHRMPPIIDKFVEINSSVSWLISTLYLKTLNFTLAKLCTHSCTLIVLVHYGIKFVK